MTTNNTQVSSAAVDIVAVLNSTTLAQVFPLARPTKGTIKEESKAMEHPLETGAQTVDHRILLPIEIEFPLVLRGDGYRQIYRELKDIYLRGDLLTVQTRVDSYPSMLMISMPHEEASDMQDGVSLILQLREVKIVTAVFTNRNVVKAAPKNSSTVKRGEQRPTETAPAKKQSVAASWGLFKK